MAAKNADLYDISPKEFFNRADVNNVIDCLSSSEDLVVFCGAGVTYDETKTGWLDLARAVLLDSANRFPRTITEREIDVLCKTLDPLELASIARSHLQMASSDGKRLPTVLHNVIRAKLYTITNWDSGRAVESICELAIARAKKKYKTQIITTNYETVLEASLVKATRSAGLPNPVVSVLHPKSLGEPREGVAPSEERSLHISLTYVHGRIPPDGSVTGGVAFSEDDYIRYRPDIEECLQRRFHGRNVLVLGSSLTDPPLLTALSRRSDGNTSGSIENVCNGKSVQAGARQQFAVIPISSIGRRSGELTKEHAEAIAEHYKLRMACLSTTLVLSDFYSQGPQLLTEAALRVTGGEGSRDYRTRLQDWATDWHKIVGSSEGGKYGLNAQFCEALHGALNKTKKKISESLKKIEDPRQNLGEHLKLEMWIRVARQGGKRSLRLVGASSWIITDHTNPRFARLSLNTGYSVVKSYQDGCPRLEQHPDTDDVEITRKPTDPRWRTFLSVPIYSERLHLPLGVVVLSSSKRERDTCITPSSSEIMRNIVSDMKRVGNAVVETQSLSEGMGWTDMKSNEMFHTLENLDLSGSATPREVGAPLSEVSIYAPWLLDLS